MDPNDDTYEAAYLAPKEKKVKLEEKAEKMDDEKVKIEESSTATNIGLLNFNLLF